MWLVLFVLGVMQSWLCDVERAMRTTLKSVLRDTRAALKKMLNKRDKWTKEWPGQVGQCAATLCCGRVLLLPL